MKKKTLILHPIIAPYRIDFFNALCRYYDSKIILYWRNLKDQTFDYAEIEKQFMFKPTYLIREEIGTCKWYKTLWKVLSEENPKIVFVSEYGSITLLTLIHRFLTRSKYKIVCITDDSYNMLAEDNHFSGRHKKAINILAPHIDEFINVEPKASMWYQKRFGKGIYFPIIVDDQKATSKYERILSVSEKLVHDYKLVGKKVLLFVGRLVQIKNVQLTIEAVKSISDSDLRFIIVGSGEYEHELQKDAKLDNRIIFIGRKEGDELYAWYNIANIFILASYQEPFGAVTNEALLGGCRCLVSKNAGSQSLIEDQQNGHVFDPYDIDDLKEKLSEELAIAEPITLPLMVRNSLMNVNFGEMINHIFNRL